MIETETGNPPSARVTKIVPDCLSSRMYVGVDDRPIYVLVLQVEEPVDNQAGRGENVTHQVDGVTEVRPAARRVRQFAVIAQPLNEFLVDHHVCETCEKSRCDREAIAAERRLKESKVLCTLEGSTKNDCHGESGSREPRYSIRHAVQRLIAQLRKPFQ